MEDTLIMDAVINKYFAGETSDREEQFLMAWLEESEEHRKYFFELKSIWNARNVFAESADLGRFAAFMRSTDARIAKIAGEERARRRRGLLRRVLKHARTATPAPVVALQVVVIAAPLTTPPELFVLGKLREGHRHVAHARIELHHGQRRSNTE